MGRLRDGIHRRENLISYQRIVIPYALSLSIHICIILSKFLCDLCKETGILLQNTHKAKQVSTIFLVIRIITLNINPASITTERLSMLSLWFAVKNICAEREETLKWAASPSWQLSLKSTLHQNSRPLQKLYWNHLEKIESMAKYGLTFFLDIACSVLWECRKGCCQRTTFIDYSELCAFEGRLMNIFMENILFWIYLNSSILITNIWHSKVSDLINCVLRDVPTPMLIFISGEIYL